MVVSKDQKMVDAIAELPKQPGLAFELSFNLQLDELHLNAGRNFWVEWFPCGNQKVLDAFIEATIGVISGECRIVESYVLGRPVRAELQRLTESGTWRGIGSWSNLGGLVPWGRQQRVLHNV